MLRLANCGYEGMIFAEENFHNSLLAGIGKVRVALSATPLVEL